MKKLSFLMLTLLGMIMFTACGDDNDEPENKQTVSATINTRLVNNDDETVTFSQSTGKIEVDYTNMKIRLNTTFIDENGQTQSVNSPDMKLTRQNGSVYYAETTSGNVGSAPLIIDFASGMMWYRTDTPTQGVSAIMTTQLLYAYTTTAISNPANGNSGSHQQSAYLFALDTRGETCILKLSNFVSTLNGSVDAPELQYEGLTVTPTSTGYTITADKIESDYKGFYTLTDVEFHLYEQCLSINGSFKCNGLEYKVTGSLFPAQSN